MNGNALFTPFCIGGMEVKNRIGMSAMGNLMANRDGTVSETTCAYYEERARGGAGMIIFANNYLNTDLGQGVLGYIWDHHHVVPKASGLTERIKAHGCRAVAQLSCGTGRNANELNGKPPYSASAVPWVWDPSVICHELTVEEIREIMKAWEYSAGLMRDAGFEAIEVHGHVGYLIDQFLSPLWNKRQDEYGGSAENRARFATDIVDAIRRGAGADFPIIYRLSLDHRIPGGRTLEDSKEILRVLDRAGVDAFDVDCGCYETIEYVYPPNYLGDAPMEYVCAAAREATDKPLLNAGSHTPETAARMIESGAADIALFGRPLIADPHMPRKLLAGRAEEVRPCLRCNEECVGRIVRRRVKLSCAVNPAAGEETAFRLEPTRTPKRVVVIGGGPAGMEAARVCAERGHAVTLYERDALGGTLRAPAASQFKSQLGKLIAYYRVQLAALGVTVREQQAIDPDDPALADCDHIIVATGGVPLLPPIPGLDSERVVGVVEAHLDPALVRGERVVVCGGGMSGSDFALEAAAELGKQVTIVEMRDEIAKDVIYFNSGALKKCLVDAGVQVRTGCRVGAVGPDGVVILDESGREETLPADTVINAFGVRAERGLPDAVLARHPAKTRLVGDCERVGKCGDAVRAGFYAGLSID